MIFLQKLAQEANSEAEDGKENTIEKKHIKTNNQMGYNFTIYSTYVIVIL